FAYCTWKDETGKFYLFGGTGSSGGNNLFNDLWVYDPAINMWAWLGGDISASSQFSGSHGGPSCEHDSTYRPGRRFENKTRWIDACGNLWLFSGFFPRSDLWKYSTVNHEWSYI